MLAWQLLVPDAPDPTVDELRKAEDQLFGSLVMVRQVRHKLTENPIHAKGQKA